MIKKVITKVTVTGADNSIAPSDLIEIHNKYPFVEFGILLSRRSMGNSRFPSSDWIKGLIETCSDTQLIFSGHICGAWVREILMGQWPVSELFDIHPGIGNFFSRWQINTHAQQHEFTPWGIQQLLIMADVYDQKIIFQFDNINIDIIKQGIWHCHRRKKNIMQALFDVSHGAGILPASWPRPLDDIKCGYAGGLSPQNIKEQLEKIIPLLGDKTIWIDAETHLRSRGDLLFDKEKVEAFLKAAKPYVVNAD
jgi:hypothetical protein